MSKMQHGAGPSRRQSKTDKRASEVPAPHRCFPSDGEGQCCGETVQAAPVKRQEDLSVDRMLEGDFILAFKWFMWLCDRITTAKGFHDNPPTDAECVALVHSEASEILEYLRGPDHGLAKADDHIPQFLGVEAEAADVVIRLASWFKRRNWRLAEAIMAKVRYNAGRPFMHGGKTL